MPLKLQIFFWRRCPKTLNLSWNVYFLLLRVIDHKSGFLWYVDEKMFAQLLMLLVISHVIISDCFWWSLFFSDNCDVRPGICSRVRRSDIEVGLGRGRQTELCDWVRSYHSMNSQETFCCRIFIIIYNDSCRSRRTSLIWYTVHWT